MRLKPKYEYKIWPVGLVIGVLTARQRVQQEGMGYVSKDHASIAIDNALEQGYRWVQTVSDYAVFEREVR